MSSPPINFSCTLSWTLTWPLQDINTLFQAFLSNVGFVFGVIIKLEIVFSIMFSNKIFLNFTSILPSQAIQDLQQKSIYATTTVFYSVLLMIPSIRLVPNMQSKAKFWPQEMTGTFQLPSESPTCLLAN